MKKTFRASLFLAALLAAVWSAQPAVLGASAAVLHDDFAASISAPDLVIEPVQGPNGLSNGQDAVYTVSLRNAESLADPIWLEIDLDAPMTTGGTILATAGFYCMVELNQYRCDGGTLANGETATLTFDVRGAGTGWGVIRVSASALGMSAEATGTPYGVTVAAGPVTN